MSILLPAQTSAEFELTPSGTHMAVCYRVIDLGTQLVEWKGESKKQRKILISWELSDEFMKEGKNEGLPFSIHKRYTLSSSDKASLRNDLESWRGKPFEDADFGTFDFGKLINVGCMIGVVHVTKNGKTYANISSIMKPLKGAEVKKPINPTVYFSLGAFDQKVYDELSENLRMTISTSPEYQKLKMVDHANVSDGHEVSLDEAAIPF